MPSSRDTWGELRSACHAARQHPREAARALWLLCVEIGGTPDFWRLEWEGESDEGEAMLTYMRQTLPPECWDAITWVRGINGMGCLASFDTYEETYEIYPYGLSLALYQCGLLWLALDGTSIRECSCVVRASGVSAVGCCDNHGVMYEAWHGEDAWDDHAQHFAWYDRWLARCPSVGIINAHGERPDWAPERTWWIDDKDQQNEAAAVDRAHRG